MRKSRLRAALLALPFLPLLPAQSYADTFGECAMFQSLLLHEHREGIAPNPERHAFIRQGSEFKETAQNIDSLVPMISSEASQEDAADKLSKVRNIDQLLKQGMLDCLYMLYP